MMDNQTAPSDLNSEELIKDIQLLGNVVQQHDQSIFQIISSLNAIQALMIDNKVCTEEDLTAKTQEEAKILQNKVMQMVNKEKEKTEENIKTLDEDTTKENLINKAKRETEDKATDETEASMVDESPKEAA